MDHTPQFTTVNGMGDIPQPIAFIDDVFRHSFWPAKEFFYDLLKVPFSKLLAQPPRPSVRQLMWRDGLLTPPSVPAGPQPNEWEWLSQYNSLNDSSKQLLSRYIDPQCLYICYEASPGLLTFLNELGLTYIDIRISPLRFMKDIVLAMRSNSREINAVMSLTSMSRADIEAEALLLASSFRHYDRYRSPPGSHAKGNDVYFVGQTATDASIIIGKGYFRIADALPILTKELHDQNVHYLPHPSADGAHMQSEMSVLASVSRSLQVESRNSYDILCSDRPATLLGISSGLMQEANLFGKRSVSLLPPACPLFFPEDEDDFESGYYQFSFDTFLSEQFWNAVFKRLPVGWRDSPRAMQPNQLRELHDVWWGYAAHKGRPNDLTRAQTRGLQAQLEHVTKAAQFLMTLIFNPPNDADPIFEQLTGQPWRWVDGSSVSFDTAGRIFKNGQNAGTWRMVAGRSLSACAIWNNGGWMDLLEFDATNNRLRCTNNHGQQFDISSGSMY
ncbi:MULTISPECIES: hypothetical protein [Rhizobium]|uniref:Uncharacterized protein n=1 Tax=Rhizobium paranaense TaxID=1650438 RepID=A0A7W9D3R9_9HYPH|nr:hypothetical protein [Rhizobium paranaense]MBB5576588.1 hypothetical protein [Rhizobium paranaense]